LQALADSIRELGVLEPVVAYYASTDSKRPLRLCSGHRRVAAARIAGVRQVPTYIVPPPEGEADAHLRRLVANVQRRDLDPIQRARTLRRILAADPALTQERLAALIGSSQPAVANALRLLDLPEGAQALVAEGHLSAGHGVALLLVKQPAVDWDGSVQHTVDEVIEGLARTAAENEYPVSYLAQQVRAHNQCAEQRRRWAESERQRAEERDAEAARSVAAAAEERGVPVTDLQAEREAAALAMSEEREREHRVAEQRRDVARSAIDRALADGPPDLRHVRLAALLLAEGFYNWGSDRAAAMGLPATREAFAARIDAAGTLDDLLPLLRAVAAARAYFFTEGARGLRVDTREPLARWADRAFGLQAAVERALEEAGLQPGEE
jgi:ParB/RepB/Spo0J family partition protein